MNMATTGKRYLKRTSSKDGERIVDARTRHMLDSIAREQRGKWLEAYLRCFARTGRSTTSMLLVLLAASSVAQQRVIVGRVADAKGAPLPFANVAVDGAGKGTSTDALGRFSLAISGATEVRLSATSIGFRTGEQLARIDRDTVRVEFALEEQVVDLPAFTVHASLTGGSGPVRDMSGSAWYIGLREVQANGYTDVSRMLRSVPGVNIVEEDGFGLRPNIGMRGAGADRSSKITLMEDGVLVAPAPYSAPAAYYFPTVARMNGIEVVKGSSQVRHGPLTTGGALNLISTPVPERTAGGIRLWGGSFGMRNLHAHAGTEVTMAQGDRVGVLVESFQQAADGFKQLDNGGPTGFQKADYLAKLQWRSRENARIPQAFALRASLNTEHSDETYLGLTADDFARTPLRRYAASAQDFMDVRQDMLSARYAVEMPWGTRIVATAYRTNTARNWYKLDQVVDSNGTKVGISSLLNEPGSRPAAMAFVRGGDSPDDALLLKANRRNYQASGVQLTATQEVKGERITHRVEAGARLHSDYMDRFQNTDGYRMEDGRMRLTSAGQPGTESNRIARATALAAHLMYDLEVGRLGLRPGVRHEHIQLAQDNYGTQDPFRTGSALQTQLNTVDVLIPGMSIDLDLGHETMLFAGVHRGFAPPGTNPETRPEASINYELGSRSRYRGWELQLIGFYNDYSELLGSDMAAAGGAGTGDLFNGGQAVVMGIEFFASWDLLYGRKDRLRMPISINYTFTDARFGSSFSSTFSAWGQVMEGDRIPYIADHQLNAHIALEGRRGSVGLGVTHVGNMPAAAGATTDAEALRIPAFTVLDARFTFRWTEHVDVFTTVQNITDRRYLVSLMPAGARPGMPRAVQVGATFRL